MNAAEACAAGCGVPMDVTLIHEGWDKHPSCEFPALAITEPDRLAAMRQVGRSRRQRFNPIRHNGQVCPWWKPKPPDQLPDDVTDTPEEP